MGNEYLRKFINVVRAYLYAEPTVRFNLNENTPERLRSGELVVDITFPIHTDIEDVQEPK